MGHEEKGKAKPSYTNAMGLNITAASITGWKQLIYREEQARVQWSERYSTRLPAGHLEEMAERVQARKAGDIVPRPDDALMHTLKEGISKEGKGRAAFLKDRADMLPQTKYRRPVVESQRIGWKCVELPPVAENMNRFGHKPVISSNFYRKTGVFKLGGHAGHQGLNMLQ